MIVKVNTAKDLSAVIRDRRKSRGWTQANLAKRIGVYQRDISNYEAKPETVSVEMLIKLCAALDLKLTIDNQPNKEVSATLARLARKPLRF